MFRNPLMNAGIILGFMLASAFAVHAQPVVTAIEPAATSIGSPIVISGSGFSSVPSQNFVTIDGIAAEVRNPTAPGAIVAIVPAGATAGDVVVTVGGQSASGPSPIFIEPNHGFVNLLQVQGDAGLQPFDHSVIDTLSPAMSITLDPAITALSSNSYRVYIIVGNTLGPVDVTASFPLFGNPLTATTSGSIPAGVSTLVVMGATTGGESFSVAGTMLNFDASIFYIDAEADSTLVSAMPDAESGQDYQPELLEVQFYAGASLNVIRDVLAANGVTPVGLARDATYAPNIPLDLYVDARRSGMTPVALRDALRASAEVENVWLNFVDSPMAVRPVGESMPTRLFNGGPRPAYNSATNNIAYNANNGGFDHDGNTVGGGGAVVGVDELDLAYSHFFYQTFAAQRLQNYVYANVNPAGGGGGPARPLLAIIDTGFGNGTANVAAGNLVLNDVPLGRLGTTDADGVAFNGIQAETGAIAMPAPLVVLGIVIPAAGDARVGVQNMLDHAGANSHGTFVALLAAGQGAAILGQTPLSNIIPYRVAAPNGVMAQNNTNASLNNIAGRGNVAVVNLSLGSSNPAANAGAAVANITPARMAALNAAWAANKITVFAAANCGVNANLFSPQTLADSQLANPLVRPLMINVAATDIPAPAAGVGPVGPEQSWRATNPPCAPGAGCPYVGTNFGNQIAVSAYGGQRMPAMNRAGTLRFSCGGTSWAAPQVAGLIAELVQLDQWVGGVPAAGAATTTRRRQIIEYVLGTADDLGTTTAAAPFVNNDAGNGPIISTDATDNNFGYGRMNSWKATLATLNRGLARQHGRAPIGGGGPGANNDSVHRNLALINDAATTWYGFEITTSVKGATAWIDGTLLNDAGAAVPANPAPANGSTIYAYKGVRSDTNIDRGIHQASDGSSSDPAVAGPPTRVGAITEGDPTTGIVAVGTSVNSRGQYVLSFSIRREDLYAGGAPKTLSLRLPGDPVAAKPYYNLLLETAKMREEAPAGAHVSGVVFDDFVFQITVPDYGDAPIAPTLMTEAGARHENTALEWLGRPDAPNYKSVTGEVNAEPEATSGNPRVDADGVDNRESFHDRDGRDDGVVFFPLTYEQLSTTGKVQFSIGVADKSDPRYVRLAGEPNPNPARSLFFNLWIDWNGDGTWDEANNEHVLDGVTIQPRNAATWNVISSGASGATVTCISTSTDRNYATFESNNVPTGMIECGTIWARARLDYGENVGRNDPRPLFRSLPSLRDPARAMGDNNPGANRGLTRGAARYGEVEDYFIGSDFGDAPDDGFGNFPTLSMNGGGHHLDFHQEWLGFCCVPLATREIDANDDNLFCGGADFGTDEDGEGNLDPENTDNLDDGIEIEPCGVCGPAFTIDVTVTSSISALGGILKQPGGGVAFPEDDADTLPRYDSEFPNRLVYLTAWADWNGNHNWDDDGEKIIDDAVYPMLFGPDGSYTLGEQFTDSNQNGVWDPGEAYVDAFGVDAKTFNYTVFPNVGGPEIPQKLWFRFRVNYGEPDGDVALQVRHCDEDGRFVDGPRGGALFGEVEDYVVLTDDTCWFPHYITEGDHNFDTTEYHADGPVGPCGGNGPDIWFAYTASCTGTAFVNTCNITNYDTVIDVYRGVGWPPPDYIDCNDDGPSPCAPQSALSFAVVAGETYSIRVAGKTGADRGPGLLKIHCKSTGPIMHVDQNVVGGNQSGSDWANAVPTLTRALELTRNSYDPNNQGAGLNVQEIWVAQGTYTPTTNANARGASFDLVGGVGHYGGFAGFEVVRNQRNPLANLTTLSGDTSHNDPVIAENSYHVVTCGNVPDTTILDGFTITAGNADGQPPFDNNGGLFFMSIQGTPRINNCIFTGGVAARGGGAIYLNERATPIISWCTIIENRVTGNCGNCGGGGVYSEFDAFPYITNSLIANNHAAASNGGGVFFRDNTQQFGAFVVNTLIDSNDANAGGGICIALHSTARIINCTIRNNSAAQFGGGVFIFRCDPYFANSIFWNDTSPLGPEFAIPFCPSNPTIENCDIQGFLAAMHLGPPAGGGNCNPNMVGANINVNPLFQGDGDLFPGSPCIDAGVNARIPSDIADIDSDMNFVEVTPLDLKIRDRIVNTTVDMGAFEVQDNSNPYGACCYPDGSCQLTTQNGCTGMWLGAGASCDPNPCPQPQPGACCLSNQTCVVQTAEQCAALGGVFIGAGSVCSPSPCVGACCHADGSCTITTLAACATQSGQFQGVGSSCTPNPCSQPSSGACCFDRGGGCLELTPAECTEFGGHFEGFGTTCGPDSCTTSPCTLGDRADSNCDGAVNNFDIDCFVASIVGGEFGWNSQGCPSGSCEFLCVNDVNGDGSVNNFDIDPFVTCIVNGGCP